MLPMPGVSMSTRPDSSSGSGTPISTRITFFALSGLPFSVA
jgi:hypothetical protein